MYIWRNNCDYALSRFLRSCKSVTESCIACDKYNQLHCLNSKQNKANKILAITKAPTKRMWNC